MATSTTSLIRRFPDRAQEDLRCKVIFQVDLEEILVTTMTNLQDQDFLGHQLVFPVQHQEL